MELVEAIIETESEGAAMAVLRKRPVAQGPWPTAVMFHDGPGIREVTHAFARELAGEGFDVVVPDLYHRQGRLLGWERHEREADPSIRDRLVELMRSLTDAGIQADLDAALAAIDADPRERLATIGFCLGARAVHRTMIRFPDRFVAGAMWHPSYLVDDEPDSPHLSADGLHGPLFMGIGEEDQIQSLADHRKYLDVVEANPTVEVDVFAGADHGYTWPGWPNFHQHAADTSFSKTVALFNGALRPSTS